MEYYYSSSKKKEVPRYFITELSQKNAGGAIRQRISSFGEYVSSVWNRGSFYITNCINFDFLNCNTHFWQYISIRWIKSFLKKTYFIYYSLNLQLLIKEHVLYFIHISFMYIYTIYEWYDKIYINDIYDIYHYVHISFYSYTYFI